MNGKPYLFSVDKNKTIVAVASGRVQGVGFRYFIHSKAVELGLKGYTKNLPNGSVETLASGSSELINDLISQIWIGSSASKVDDVRISEIPYDSTFQNFTIELI